MFLLKREDSDFEVTLTQTFHLSFYSPKPKTENRFQNLKAPFVNSMLWIFNYQPFGGLLPVTREGSLRQPFFPPAVQARAPTTPSGYSTRQACPLSSSPVDPLWSLSSDVCIRPFLGWSWQRNPRLYEPDKKDRGTRAS